MHTNCNIFIKRKKKPSKKRKTEKDTKNRSLYVHCVLFVIKNKMSFIHYTFLVDNNYVCIHISVFIFSFVNYCQKIY